MKRLWVPVVALEFALVLGATYVLMPGVYHVARWRVEWFAPSAIHLFIFASHAVVLAAGLALLARRESPLDGLPLLARCWLPLVANAAIVARAALKAEPVFIEPVILATSVGASAALSIFAAMTSGPRSANDLPKAPGESRVPALATALAALLAAAWMYGIQEYFLSRLYFGWIDAGLYYMRIKNTALGKGLLQETLALPPFYDHFDAGLLFFVPLYWVFRSYRIIMWIQAISLAAIGPAVYVYARGRGLSGWSAFTFSLAALLHPSIAQMSYAWSYGFHPIIVAIPAAILSLHFWEKGRLAAFAVCAGFAATMEESVFPLYVGVGLVELLSPGGRRMRGAVLAAASAGFFVVITKFVMPIFTGPVPYFQLLKYWHLGHSFVEILLSPVTKAGIFWGLLFGGASVFYLAVILGGMLFLPFFAPRQLCYPLVVLVFTLLFENPNVKIICYQYQSLVLAAWLPATVAGAVRISGWSGGARAAKALGALGSGVLVAAYALSHFCGLLPFSRPTMPFQVRRTAEYLVRAERIHSFARTVRPTSRVLATMRAAMLFSDAGDVVPLRDWDGKTADYDIVVLELYDDWGQGSEQLLAARDAFAADGAFELVPMENFIVMVRRKPL